MLRRKDSFHESFIRHLYTGDASQPKWGNATLTHSLHCHPLLFMVVPQQLWLPTWSDPARFNKRPCLGQDFQALQCFWVLSFRQRAPRDSMPQSLHLQPQLIWVNTPAWMLLRDMHFPSSKSSSMIWFMVGFVPVLPVWAVHPFSYRDRKANTLVCSRAKARLYISNLLLKSSRVICWEALEITCNS